MSMEELNDFRRRLETHFQDLTKSEQRIASYLLSNYDEAAFLPAAELATRLDVSQATVVRFAKSVGYDSFPEMRRCLQEIFRVKITPASRLQRRLEDLKSGQGHVLHKTIAMELQYLTEAEHSVDTADFDRAVEIVAAAQRVFVFGTGPSRILCDLLQTRLRRFGLPIVILTESGRDVLEKLLLLQPADAMVAMGFHRVTGELVAVLDQARAVGCHTVLLTDTLGATFRDKVDIVLSARRGPVSTFHSLTVPMVILNALILAVAMARPDTSLDALKRLEQLRVDYGLDFAGKLT
jgi:DNA-binding MurR/RpiR family transcriptional regulator